MHTFSTANLALACRLFLECAYPGGPDTMPPKKRAYYEMAADRPLADFLPPSPAASGIVEPLSGRKDGPRGYSFRLGCSHFPHLKLRVQAMEHRGEEVWVYMVDTHDAFSRTSTQPPADHPDAQGWLLLQGRNRSVKEQAEEALELAGFLTFKTLLKLDLEAHAQR